MITITITREELLSHNPCEDSGGVELFDSICELSGARGVLQVVDWTPLHSLWLLAQCSDKYSWLRSEGLIPDVLRGADLYGANLCGANLGGADLYGANLRWANIRWANLRWANIRWANLSGADLRGTNLRGAKLSGADLYRADLSEANLSGANLTRAYRPDSPPPGWEPDEAGYLRLVDESGAP